MESSWRRDVYELGLLNVWETAGGIVQPSTPLCSRILTGIFTDWYCTNYDITAYTLLALMPTGTGTDIQFGFALKPDLGKNFPYGFDVTPDMPL